MDDLGIDLHYYGFRVYDPAIGRFTSVDPIAEQFAFVSGFNYAENEPIANIDLHGLQKVGFEFNFKQGTYGADARVLGLRAGAIADIDSRRVLGFELSGNLNGTTNINNWTGSANGNFMNDESGIGLGGGVGYGGETFLLNNRETGTTSTVNEVGYGLGNLRVTGEEDRSGKNVSADATVGAAIGLEVGIGIIGFEFDLTVDFNLFSDNSNSTPTIPAEQGIQQDNTRVIIIDENKIPKVIPEGPTVSPKY